MNDPNVFSKIDADRILKRAAEIEGSEDAKPLTVKELRSIAQEAGFGVHAVERAIAEAKRAASREVRTPPVQKTGIIITNLSTHRSLPVSVSSEELMRAVRLFQPYWEGPAQVELQEERITWRDRKGIRFTVSSSEATTEIHVYVSKPILLRGRWIGWVKSAADRLETTVFMVATQGSRSIDLLPSLPNPDDPAAGTG